MVASSKVESGERHEVDAAHEEHEHFHAHRGGLRRLIASIVRLADLQLKIWLTQAKIVVNKLLMAALLYGAAGIVAILAVIFLYIGVFKLLTDVAGLAPVWAYLIYGVFHLGLAIGLIFMAKRILNKDTSGEAKREAHDELRREGGVE